MTVLPPSYVAAGTPSTLTVVGTTTQSLNISTPAGIINDDLLVLLVWAKNGGANTPAGWTQYLYQSPPYGTWPFHSLQIFTRTWHTGDPTNFTISIVYETGLQAGGQTIAFRNAKFNVCLAEPRTVPDTNLVMPKTILVEGYGISLYGGIITNAVANSWSSSGGTQITNTNQCGFFIKTVAAGNWASNTSTVVSAQTYSNGYQGFSIGIGPLIDEPAYPPGGGKIYHLNVNDVDGQGNAAVVGQRYFNIYNHATGRMIVYDPNILDEIPIMRLGQPLICRYAGLLEADSDYTLSQDGNIDDAFSLGDWDRDNFKITSIIKSGPFVPQGVEFNTYPWTYVNTESQDIYIDWNSHDPQDEWDENEKEPYWSGTAWHEPYGVTDARDHEWYLDWKDYPFIYGVTVDFNPATLDVYTGVYFNDLYFPDHNIYEDYSSDWPEYLYVVGSAFNELIIYNKALTKAEMETVCGRTFAVEPTTDTIDVAIEWTSTAAVNPVDMDVYLRIIFEDGSVDYIGTAYRGTDIFGETVMDYTTPHSSYGYKVSSPKPTDSWLVEYITTKTVTEHTSVRIGKKQIACYEVGIESIFNLEGDVPISETLESVHISSSAPDVIDIDFLAEHGDYVAGDGIIWYGPYCVDEPPVEPPLVRPPRILYDNLYLDLVYKDHPLAGWAPNETAEQDLILNNIRRIRNYYGSRTGLITQSIEVVVPTDS